MINKIKNVSNFYLIFSDLFPLFIKNEPAKIIDSIDKIVQSLIKNKKTLILPTFNLNFPKEKKTSFNERYIQTGFINKYLLKKYEFKRTLRPMYNYAVIGPDTKKIINLKQTTAWGKDSVIGYLVKNKALAIGLNIDTKKFNWLAIHHCEEINKVPYRYFKIFKGRNNDLKRIVSEKMFVRNLNLGLVEDGKNLNKLLIRNKIIKKIKFGKINISLLNLFKYYIEANKMLKKNIYSLVKHEK